MGPLPFNKQGSLILPDSWASKLPDDLVVEGHLNLLGCELITELPEGLKVGGWVDIRGTNIAKLPDNLTIGGYFDLERSKIRTLPKSLHVGGWMDLTGLEINTLPKDLRVGGWLNIVRTGITKLPDDLLVGKELIVGDSLVTCCEELQLKLVGSSIHNIKTITDPTDRTKRMHNMKWKI